jgi:hypothetical protein
MIRAIILSLIAVGCREETRVDPDLRPMLDLYLAHAPSDGKLEHLKEMIHGDTGESFGMCWKRSRPQERRIHIKPGLDEMAQNLTALHELGHCLHDLDHTDDPKSIMYAGGEPIPDDGWWREHMIDQLKAMFGGG